MTRAYRKQPRAPESIRSQIIRLAVTPAELALFDSAAQRVALDTGAWVRSQMMQLINQQNQQVNHGTTN